MERLATTPLDVPVHGYSRAELDAFLASVAVERERLEAAIAADEERTRTARAALGTHRIMVSMLLEAQREIDDIRARAEAEAALILASHRRVKPLLDLTRLERDPDIAPPPATDGSALAATHDAAPTSSPDGTVEYFDFLRGALDDDAPLGPGPEPA
jgi:cell division septum initiation protein DivIVA